MTSVIACSVTGIVLALLLGTYYQFIKKAGNESKVDQKNITLVEVAGWKIKESVEKSSESTCDLLRIDTNNINSHLLDDLFRSNVPFVIVNSMADWPATKEWTRFNFISKFGKRTVKTDSESTIVQGGGLASPSASFESLLAQVRNCSLRNSVECSDDFVFDTAIVRSIPELDQDIKVLPVFQNWDNPQQRRSQSSWHMLSLGPIQTGLPFHSHGKTWLSLVHGAKSWYLYPPGFDVPSERFPDYTSLEQVTEMRQNIEAKLALLPSPITFHQANYTWSYHSSSSGYKPLFCLQRAGEIMYLPDLWSHFTVNEGETIAYGGQAALSPERRYSLSRQKLDMFPRDFESLKNAGLGLGHMSISLLHQIQSMTQSSGSLLRVEDEHSLRQLAEMTEDVWVRVYFNRQVISSDSTSPKSQQNTVSAESALKMLQSLAEKGSGQWNTVLLHEDVEYLEEKESEGEYISLQQIRVAIDCKPTLSSIITYQPSHIDDLTSLLEDIEQWIAATIHVYYLESGSVLGGNSRKIMKMLDETRGYLRKAMKNRPYRVECWRVLAEVTGGLGFVEDARDVVREAAELFRAGLSIQASDSISKRNHTKLRLTRRASASIFHQLATSLLSISSPTEAIELLNEALRIDSSHLPSMVDRVVAYLMNNNIGKARTALLELEAQSPRHPGIARLKAMLQR